MLSKIWLNYLMWQLPIPTPQSYTVEQFFLRFPSLQHTNPGQLSSPSCSVHGSAESKRLQPWLAALAQMSHTCIHPLKFGFNLTVPVFYNKAAIQEQKEACSLLTQPPRLWACRRWRKPCPAAGACQPCPSCFQTLPATFKTLSRETLSQRVSIVHSMFYAPLQQSLLIATQHTERGTKKQGVPALCRTATAALPRATKLPSNRVFGSQRDSVTHLRVITVYWHYDWMNTSNVFGEQGGNEQNLHHGWWEAFYGNRRRGKNCWNFLLTYNGACCGLSFMTSEHWNKKEKTNLELFSIKC